MSSLLTNAECVAAWRKTYPGSVGLILLDEYIKNGVRNGEARKAIYKAFRNAGDMFFEGLATKDGFGCEQQPSAGHHLVCAAAKARNCPEALNYLGLCCAQVAPLTSLHLFLRASKLGHEQARDNLRLLRSKLPASNKPRMLCAI